MIRYAVDMNGSLHDENERRMYTYLAVDLIDDGEINTGQFTDLLKIRARTHDDRPRLYFLLNAFLIADLDGGDVPDVLYQMKINMSAAL